jgi:hypothetical protein
MIIFFNKKTGDIVGTVQDRIHTSDHLKMWVGDKDETDRLIVEWKPTGKETVIIIEEPIFEEYVDDEGFTETHQVGTKKRKEKNVEFEPDHPQRDIFIKLDKQSSKIYDYKVNLKTKRLVKKK